MKTYKGYGLVLKRPRYGDDEKGDLQSVFLSHTLAKQAKVPRYHKIVKLIIEIK